MRRALMPVMLALAGIAAGDTSTMMAQSSGGQVDSQAGSAVSSLISSRAAASAGQSNAVASGELKLRIESRVSSGMVKDSLSSGRLSSGRIASETSGRYPDELRRIADQQDQQFGSQAMALSRSSPGYSSSGLTAAMNLSGSSVSPESGTGSSSRGRTAVSAGVAMAGKGQFPDSTRGKVGISPPFTGENLFQFSPVPPGFYPDFDVRHLNPNYQSTAGQGMGSRTTLNGGSLTTFNPDNLQQSPPVAKPTTSPADPIAGALQGILHPDQQVQNP